ncbi:MAG: RNA-binding protein [Nitrospinae bacterium]|nr:RNA-binding protein [Nitrospinota bacterium]
MEKKLYVGNLSYKTRDEELRTLFAEAGGVVAVKILTDRETGRSRGFGFVEMESEEAAEAAIAKFDGYNMDGRRLKVDESRPQDRAGGGGDRGDRGDRGGRGGNPGGGQRRGN